MLYMKSEHVTDIIRPEVNLMRLNSFVNMWHYF